MLKQLWTAGAVLLFLTGCGSQNADINNNNNNNNGLREVKQSVNEPNKNLSARDISKRLVRLATDVPGVNDATAVVAGDYAVVGIDVDKDLDHTRVGSIKYAVTNALKNDPYGANAVVTSDPDIVQRLRNMGAHIRNGRPISGIANELASIVERIVPEVPNRPLEPSQNIENKQPRQPIDRKPDQPAKNAQ
ncbi:MAG: YhcN/YlaJ family sporulation lipoprotein [Tuberibacillus sp.]